MRLNNLILNLISKIKNNNFWKNLVKNSFWAFFGDTFSSIINLIITIILIILIGNTGYSILILAQSYMSIMDVLINVQCWKSVIQYGQKALVNNNKIAFLEYVKLGCALDIFTALLGGITAFLLANFIGNALNWSSELILCTKIFSLTIFSHFSGTPTAILRILNKFNYVAIQKIVSSLIKIFSLLFILIFYKNISVISVIIVYSITDVIGNILLIFFAFYIFSKRYNIKELLFRTKIMKDIDFIKFTFWGSISEIVDIPVNYFDVFILSYLNTELISVYKVFKQLVAILSKLTTPIYQAILPQFSELSAKGLKRDGYRIVIKIRNLILKLIIPIALVVGFSSPIWLNLIYGKIYANNWLILLILLLVQSFALSYTTIHPYFISIGKVKKSALYVFIANVIYVFFAICLTKKFGMIALVFSYLIQCSIVICLKVREIKRSECYD